jgi:hypothetical protein
VILALILAIALPQDEVSGWIVQLESDSLAVREEAIRKLTGLGPEAVARLEKARDDAKSAEVRARLEGIVAHIKKMAELSKAFGPTRRVTLASRGQLLKEVLAPLKAPFVSAIDTGVLDEEARIDVQVRDVTWWEALDRVAHAAGAHYLLEGEDNGRIRIKLVKGRERDWPVVYANQFRISVREATRVESRALGETGTWDLVLVELRYQPDLKPQSGWSEDSVQILSILDAKGVNVKDDRPEWAASNPRHAFGASSFLSENWVRANAAQPLTVTGTTNVCFPSKTTLVEIGIGGGKARAGPAKFEVVKAAWEKDESLVKIRVEAEGVADLHERMSDAGISVVDSKGERHPGRISSWTRTSDNSFAEWELVFTGGIALPRKVVFAWVEEIHNAQIPFRLEGVRLPDPASK